MDEKKLIMILEDEPLLGVAIQEKVKIMGMDALLFNDPREGLDYLKAAKRLPDAIWLDYYLGKQSIDGLAVMHELKKEARLSEIPIIVVSNSASDEKVKTMLALGAKQYILKADQSLTKIIRTVKGLIKEHEEDLNN